jgi:hypothetical protein
VLRIAIPLTLLLAGWSALRLVNAAKRLAITDLHVPSLLELFFTMGAVLLVMDDPNADYNAVLMGTAFCLILIGLGIMAFPRWRLAFRKFALLTGLSLSGSTIAFSLWVLSTSASLHTQAMNRRVYHHIPSLGPMVSVLVVGVVALWFSLRVRKPCKLR